MEFGFVCHKSYACRCGPDKIVSKVTALTHRSEAQRRQGDDDFATFLPMPKRVPLLGLPDGQLLPEESQSANDVQNQMGRSYSADDLYPQNANVAHDQSLAGSYPISTPNRGVEYDEPNLRLDNVLRSDSLVDQLQCDSLFQVQDDRFDRFMRDNSWMIGYSIRHHSTEAEMDDLLKHENSRNQIGSCIYTSWKGIQSALTRISGISTEIQPCCPERHAALEVRADGSILPCPERGCTSTNSSTFSSTYEYIRLWPQIDSRLKSTETGPLLFEYYQEGLARAQQNGERSRRYEDFFSGSLFHKIQSDLGGWKCIENDIFVMLSTDGINAFNSVQYSFWPVVLLIANLPPSERYKMENIIPVMVIPGSKSPKDINSFLTPLLDELSYLSKHGVLTRRWDGSVIRVHVHLIFALLDLPAAAKVCLLSGHNGTYPCRFCCIRGIWDQERNHNYYPSMRRIYVKGKAGKRRRVVQALWDPHNLHMRTHEEVMSAYRRISGLQQLGRRREAEAVRAKNGFSRFHPTPFLELPTMFAFSSFPVDIMHLLYENVAPFIVSLWTSNEVELQDISVLSNKKIFSHVDSCLASAGKGLSPSCTPHSPRSLRYRGQWKATEWKTFVLTTSTSALHEWIPRRVLDGWYLFVQLCEIVSEWELSEELVDRVEELARGFYEHFISDYYKMRPDRLRLCRYTLHLLLHLADNIRSCGPVSMLGQWTMETLAGVMKLRCNAKNKFAESVAENVKREISAKLYSVLRGIRIPYLDVEDREPVSARLRVGSELDIYDGYFFRHPRKEYQLDKLESKYFPGLQGKIAKYYASFYNIELNSARGLVQGSDKVCVWKRLEDEKAVNNCEVLYRCYTPGNQATFSRSSCYFSGVFHISDEQALEACYGRALAFIQHHVEQDTHMIFLASWVTRGLHVGEQGQVYSKKHLSANSLFSSITVEGVNCVSHPIGVMETVVPNRSNRLSKRTYFFDELRGRCGMLGTEPWSESLAKMTLRGKAL